uniref:DH domain-containing protein n=1 Tax=Lotharella globosa TaxID=91324 RepID=A0A7S4E1D0_9EUKA
MRNLEAGEKDVGIIIADFAQYFKMYMPYVQNHEGATETLKALCKSSKKFRKALAKYEEEAKCSLQSLLILPIQRIPRYKLLLETLIKNTHPHDKSYAPLNKALSDIRKSASHINSSIEEREASKKLTELQAMFTGHITLVAPSRKYIMNQTMNKLTKGGALQERQFFLFTDMLLYATDDVTFSDKLRVRQMMPIDKSFLLSDLNRKGHMLYVASSVKNVTISFASNEDLEKWKAALTQCMENQRNKIGFNYNDRSHLAKGSKSPRRDEKKDLGPVFTSYSYGYAAEEKSKEDLEFYEQMRHVETTRRYFDTLQKQTKLYLQEQLTLVKVATAFAHKLEGDDKILLSRAMWYRAMAAIATMVAVHSHEMLRWKSVTELLIDSISWLLNEPIKDALALKKEYAKRCYELQQAKKNSEKAAYKKNPKPERVQAAFQAVLGAEKAFETAKNDAIEGCNTMDSAIKRGFVDKLKLFVRVQTDYHKDCYYDIRRCWEQIRKSEEEVKAFDAARVRAAREEKARLEAEANTPKSIDENKPSVKLRLSEVSTRSST